MWNIIWTGVRWVLGLIGLGGIVDDLAGWGKYLHFINAHLPESWDVYGTWARVLIFFGSCLLVLVAFDVHRKLLNLWQRKDVPSRTNRPRVTLPRELAYDSANDKPLIQSHFESGFDSTRPTLEIQFIDSAIGQRYFTWKLETEHGKQVSVQRYSVLLENASRQDAENVSVKLERVLEEDADGEAPYLGYELQLDPASTRIRRGDKAWVPLISYRKGDAWISIEGIDREKTSKEGKMFHPYQRRQLHMVVRADMEIVLPARFQCWVDDNGCLIMKRLNLDIPNSLNR